MIYNLVNDFKREQCVINYRGFTPKMKSITNFDYSKRNKDVKKEIYTIFQLMVRGHF